MYNPKNFPQLVKDLALVFGRRKARAMVKAIKTIPAESPQDGTLGESFVWDKEDKGHRYWMAIYYQINDQKRRHRDKRLEASRKK